MVNLSSIGDIRFDDVYAAIERTFQHGLSAASMAAFLDGVDWGEATEKESDLATALLDLLNWTTMYEEGELSERQYADKLVGLLPAGGSVRITITH